LTQVSPQLRALGPDIRLLAVFIDAIAAYGEDCPQVQARVDSAMLAEREEGDGWREGDAARTMRQWGARDQHGIYAAAGLNKTETEVAFMHYDRQLEPVEIARLLKRDPATVRTQLYRAKSRLFALAGGSVETLAG
jgi:DNA-directed RNA polymerase specialized sigma24 family protein